MAKITKLTAEQEVALVEWRKRWLDVGICCEPANFERAEEVITDFYRRLGKPRPIFFRFSSPMMCELGVAALKDALTILEAANARRPFLQSRYDAIQNARAAIAKAEGPDQ